MHRTSRAGSVSSTRQLRTNAWTADVSAIEAAIQDFELRRPLTNESNAACFEIHRDANLHVNVTHRYPTHRTAGWAGPATLPAGVVHNRTFGDVPPTVIARCIRDMVFARRS